MTSRRTAKDSAPELCETVSALSLPFHGSWAGSYQCARTGRLERRAIAKLPRAAKALARDVLSEVESALAIRRDREYQPAGLSANNSAR